ncbi:transposase [Pseudomonas aeruginosa]
MGDQWCAEPCATTAPRKKLATGPCFRVVLGIDELLVGGEYRCVLINLEERTIIDVLPNRKKIVIHNYISNMRGRDRVQIVCQDMFHPYKRRCR